MTTLTSNYNPLIVSKWYHADPQIEKMRNESCSARLSGRLVEWIKANSSIQILLTLST